MLFCKFKKPVLVAAAALLWLAVQTPVTAFELLTDEQIAAVSQQEYTFKGTPPHPQAPRITVRRPQPSNGVKSPFDIEIEFSPHGNATIKPESLKIQYGWFDITQYVLETGKAEISPQGIKVRGAEIKKGDYPIVISIEDSQGRIGMTEVKLVVL